MLKYENHRLKKIQAGFGNKKNVNNQQYLLLLDKVKFLEHENRKLSSHINSVNTSNVKNIKNVSNESTI